jgi:hypothetical protein
MNDQMEITWKIRERISDYEHGYPDCDARFLNEKEWANYMKENGFTYDVWKISLGYCGSVDCMLVLHNSIGERRAYGVESQGWLALSPWWSIKDQAGGVPVERAKEIWNMQGWEE